MKSSKSLNILDLTAFEDCQLCPRNCQVHRLAGEVGACGETAELRIAAIEAHFGEEPPLSGENGSGTVFFSGCSLKCEFCQNYQISTDGIGRKLTVKAVANQLVALAASRQIHNINFVTPDHFFPYCIQIVKRFRQTYSHLPLLFNLSGYQKIEILKILSESADIYLPDFKYSDPNLARTLSRAEDYPQVALNAISEMARQKGFLNSFSDENMDTSIATRGILVRHLILPGFVNNSLNALTSLFLEFGPELPVSLMSQYLPVKQNRIQSLNRRITASEFKQVYEHVQTLGFKNLFVQFPASDTEAIFLPDFKKPHPFKGNISS